MAEPDEPLVTLPRVAAATVASVASFLVATQLGVLGTVVGVALISVLATVGSAFLEEYLGRGQERLRDARRTPDEPATQPADHSFYDTWDQPAVTGPKAESPAGDEPTAGARQLPTGVPAARPPGPAEPATQQPEDPTQQLDAATQQLEPPGGPAEAPGSETHLPGDPTQQLDAATQQLETTKQEPDATGEQTQAHGEPLPPDLDAADQPTQLLPTVTTDVVAAPPTTPPPAADQTRSRRPLSWRSKRLWMPTLVVFGFAMGAVVVAELTGQTPPREPVVPSPTVTATATATVTVTSSPSAAVTVTATPTVSVSPTATPTPTATASPTGLAETTPAG